MFTLASGISDVPFSTNNEPVKEILNIDGKKLLVAALKKHSWWLFFKIIINK